MPSPVTTPTKHKAACNERSPKRFRFINQDMDNMASPPAPTRPRTACDQCALQHQRCIIDGDLQSPCQRCQSRDLPCSFMDNEVTPSPPQRFNNCGSMAERGGPSPRQDDLLLALNRADCIDWQKFLRLDGMLVMLQVRYPQMVANMPAEPCSFTDNDLTPSPQRFNDNSSSGSGRPSPRQDDLLSALNCADCVDWKKFLGLDGLVAALRARYPQMVADMPSLPGGGVAEPVLHNDEPSLLGFGNTTSQGCFGDFNDFSNVWDNPFVTSSTLDQTFAEMDAMCAALPELIEPFGVFFPEGLLDASNYQGDIDSTAAAAATKTNTTTHH